MALLVSVGVAGCDDPTGPEAVPGSVSGVVLDPFGSPLQGALVSTETGSAVSDAQGVFNIDGVLAGATELLTRRAGFREERTAVVIVGRRNVQVTVQLEPESLPSAGALATRVVGVNGTRLTFEVDAFVTDADARPMSGLSAGDFLIGDFGDLSFSAEGFSGVAGQAHRSYSAALLLDQSGSITGTDPNDSRIVAAKTFLNALGGGDDAVVAAFSTGGNLPHEPLTIWGNGFTSNGRSYFGVLDALAGQEGGGTPLYRAAASMVEYTSSNAPRSNRAVIVFTDGEDTAGGLDLDDVVERANARGVPIYAVGLSSGVDAGVLSELAMRTGGAVMWAGDARQLVSAYRTLGGVLGGSVSYYRTRWTAHRLDGRSWGSGGWLTSSVSVRTPDGTLSVPFYVGIR